MKWTTKKPTEPGWYWMSHRECIGKRLSRAVIYEVIIANGELIVVGFGGCWRTALDFFEIFSDRPIKLPSVKTVK